MFVSSAMFWSFLCVCFCGGEGEGGGGGWHGESSLIFDFWKKLTKLLLEKNPKNQKSVTA